MGQVQGISGYQNAPADFQQSQISTPLKALIFAVTAVAGAALGFLLAGLSGLAIGALVSTGLGFVAIAIINNFMGQPQVFLPEPAEIEIQALTDVTDVDAAEGLIKFYNLLPIDGKPQFEGSISEKAQQIQAWMKGPEICNRKELDLSNLNLMSLPKEIGLFSNLKGLSLKKNRLKDLPAQIGNLRSLRFLNLSQNKLQTLPAEIGNLLLLKDLFLHNNELQTLPPEIGKLRSLTQLSLFDNKLQTLPAEIVNLKSLTTLNLWFNKFQALPAEVGQLPSLTNLKFSQNNLFRRDLPARIGNLENNGEGVYTVGVEA